MKGGNLVSYCGSANCGSAKGKSEVNQKSEGGTKMKTGRNIIRILALAVLAAGLLAVPGIMSAADCPCRSFTTDFMMGRCKGFSSEGANPFFLLKEGFQAIFEGKEGKTVVHVTITVLEETLTIEGIETRVVEEKELHNGVLAELSRNYFAICNRTNSVFYFGEDVDMYDPTGKIIVSHEGTWHAGVNGAKAGIVMPGVILNGGRYFQEIAPGVAMDRAEIVGRNFTVETPAGTFDNCLKTKESTPLEPDVFEIKYYAPGIGLVKDDTLSLISFSGN